MNDNVDPVISGIPSDITMNAEPDRCGALVSWEPPEASDNCSINSFFGNYNPGDLFDVGTTTVTYIAEDQNSNTTSKSFNITIIDNEAPEFTFCPSSFEEVSSDSVNGKSIISWQEPQAIDNCGEVTVVSNYNPVQEFDFGTHTVTYTATDESGNQAYCTVDITAGFNRYPIAEESSLKFEQVQGEPLDILLEVYDPDGDQLSIDDIIYDPGNAEITNIDSDNLRFTYTSSLEYYGFDTLLVIISDNGIPSRALNVKVVVEVERIAILRVSSALTMNGDGINDNWYLENIDLFPNNSVYIYDRWGGLVFQTNGYDNITNFWSGNSNQSNARDGDLLPKGTYFYVIYTGNGTEKMTGAIEVIR
jgi:gliding motility-associated-like protein